MRLITEAIPQAHRSRPSSLRSNNHPEVLQQQSSRGSASKARWIDELDAEHPRFAAAWTAIQCCSAACVGCKFRSSIHFHNVFTNSLDAMLDPGWSNELSDFSRNVSAALTGCAIGNCHVRWCKVLDLCKGSMVAFLRLWQLDSLGSNRTTTNWMPAVSVICMPMAFRVGTEHQTMALQCTLSHLPKKQLRTISISQTRQSYENGLVWRLFQIEEQQSTSQLKGQQMLG